MCVCVCVYPYLLDLGVLLDVDLLAPVAVGLHGAHGVQGDAAGQTRPVAQGLSVDGRVDDLQHHRSITHVHRNTGNRREREERGREERREERGREGRRGERRREGEEKEGERREGEVFV